MKTMYSPTRAVRAASTLALATALGFGAVPGTVAPADEVVAAPDAAQAVAGPLPVSDPAQLVGGQLKFWEKHKCLLLATLVPFNPVIGVPVLTGCYLFYRLI